MSCAINWNHNLTAQQYGVTSPTLLPSIPSDAKRWFRWTWPEQECEAAIFPQLGWKTSETRGCCALKASEILKASKDI